MEGPGAYRMMKARVSVERQCRSLQTMRTQIAKQLRTVLKEWLPQEQPKQFLNPESNKFLFSDEKVEKLEGEDILLTPQLLSIRL